MIELDYIDFDENIYYKLIHKVDGTAQIGKELLLPHYSILLQQINNYKTYAPNLENLQPLSSSLAHYSRDELHIIMNKFYATNKKLKDKIKALNKDDNYTNDGFTCPYCGIFGQKMKDLDHYIPRSIYPEFSILSNNLIYACKECNQDNKEDKFIDDDGNRMFLNPYYDNQLTNSELLKCTITVTGIFIAFTFSISEELETSDNYIYLIATNHLKELKLDERYSHHVRKDLLESFLNYFTDKRDKYRRHIQNLEIEKCQSYIDGKIRELGEVNQNNFKLLFWNEFRNCTEYFENISGRIL